MQEDDNARDMILRGRLKAQILKQIFKDLSPKNLKGVDSFYILVSPESLEMQFISNAKDIMITILLRRGLFAHYAYPRARASLLKYALEDFAGLGFLFENNKHALELELTYQYFSIVCATGQGRTEFRAIAMSCNQDDEDRVITENQLRPNEQSSMQLRLSRVGLFEGILSYAKSCKLETLWLHYESQRKMLRVADAEEGAEASWLLKVEEPRLFNFDHRLQLHCRSLACALNLLPNDAELALTFYQDAMLLDINGPEKTFAIRLNSVLKQ